MIFLPLRVSSAGACSLFVHFLSSLQRTRRMRREPEVKRKCRTKRDFCQQNEIPTTFYLFYGENLTTLTMWISRLKSLTNSISRIKGKKSIGCFNFFPSSSNVSGRLRQGGLARNLNTRLVGKWRELTLTDIWSNFFWNRTSDMDYAWY